MAYTFETQNMATTKAAINRGQGQAYMEHNINCINGTQTNADSIMSGLSDFYSIVGWEPYNVVRTVKQNVNDNV